MSTDSGKAMLKEARIEGKAIKATATGSLAGTKSGLVFDARIDVSDANLNAYLPAEETLPAEGTQPRRSARPRAPQPHAAAGWSDAPIAVALPPRVRGKVDIRFASIRYRDLVIDSGRAEIALASHALKLALQHVKLANGSIDAAASLATTTQGLAIDYQASGSGLQARPLLDTFAGIDRLSGTAAFTAKGHAVGQSQKALIQTLDGSGSFTFRNGAIHGINIAALLREARTLGFDQNARSAQKTDFAELSGTYTIGNGVLVNKDLKMLAPVLRLAGNGEVRMPPRTLDYRLTATLVATLKGQGGKEGSPGCRSRST